MSGENGIPWRNNAGTVPLFPAWFRRNKVGFAALQNGPIHFKAEANMAKAAIDNEAPEKGMIDKGLDKLVELRGHAAEKAAPAQDAAPALPEEDDERRPLWVRLAILSVPVIVGAVVKRAFSRRSAAKAAADKASRARKKTARAKAARA